MRNKIILNSLELLDHSIGLPAPLDGRKILPVNLEGKKWKTRDVGTLKGMVWHQELGWGSVESVAKYHIGPESHLGEVMSIAYTFAIRRNGQVVLCNDLNKATWSQGFKDRRGDENVEFLSVMFEGLFTADGIDNGGEPTDAQMLSGLALWKVCRDLWEWDGSNLFGHTDFGKPTCPGDTLQNIIYAVRFNGSGFNFNEIRGRQAALASLGYYRGTVDGAWGVNSKKALVNFQHAENLVPDGTWGSKTEAAIKSELFADRR